MDQTLHRVAAKKKEEIKRTTKQKMARRHSKEGGYHLGQESNRQKTMEDFDGGRHPSVDGQRLGERRTRDTARKVKARTAYLNEVLYHFGCRFFFVGGFRLFVCLFVCLFSVLFCFLCY